MMQMKETTYIYEAIVEEEAKDGSAHPRLNGDGLGHDRAHNLMKARAACGVVRDRQLFVCGGRHKREHGKEEETLGEVHALYKPVLHKMY